MAMLPSKSTRTENFRENFGNKFKDVQKYFHRKSENNKLPKQQDKNEESFVKAIETPRKIRILEYDITTQSREAFETQYWSEDRFKKIWEVSCVAENNIDGSYKFIWKVQLKLKPTRKTVTIHQTNVCDALDNRNIQATNDKYKIVLVGDSGVGKTSFIRRFCRDTFKLSFHSTVGVDYQEKQIVVNGKRCKLQLWDTAGQERFRSMCVQYYRHSDAIIAIYDITCEDSFKNIRWWMDNIKENTSNEKILMIIGNKTDAIDFRMNNEVKTICGENLAKEYDALFFETSVKFDENVKESISALTKALQKRIADEEARVQIAKKEEKKRKWC